MKPIDMVTSLPKSPDVARLADTAARQGDARFQSQSSTFSKEVSEKARIVSKSQKPEKLEINKDSQQRHNAEDDNSTNKNLYESDEEEGKELFHSTKGQIIDIRGA